MKHSGIYLKPNLFHKKTLFAFNWNDDDNNICFKMKQQWFALNDVSLQKHKSWSSHISFFFANCLIRCFRCWNSGSPFNQHLRFNLIFFFFLSFFFLFLFVSFFLSFFLSFYLRDFSFRKTSKVKEGFFPPKAQTNFYNFD